MKPRPLGSAPEALTRLFAEIAQIEGYEPTAGAKLAANFLGVSDSLIRKASDPDQPEDLGFRRVAMLTERFAARAAAEHLALCAGGIFLPLPAGDGQGRWHDLGAIASEEFSQVIAALFRATSNTGPGGADITPAERRKLVAEIDDVIRVMVEMRSRLRGHEGHEP
jgi:hypothetical protein